MDKVIRKAFYHYEKEEKWLNEMAAKGLALVSYTWCRYVFEPCEPGEYIYRIELLSNKPSHPESLAYIDFVKETGAQTVTCYSNWVYFRRKATEGPFDIYSDADSRISHYKRILNLWGVIGLCNLTIWLSTFFNAMDSYKEHGSTVMLFLSCFNLICGLFLTGLCIPYLFKIRRLKKEKKLRE